MLYMRFLHFVGLSLWIGGAVAAFTLARALSAQAVDVRRIGWGHLSRLHAFVIGPGAMITVISGVMLTMSLVNRGATAVMARPGIVTMQGAGVVAAVIALFVGVPTANQLAALGQNEGELRPEDMHLVKRLRKRQAIASSIAGVLTLVAMFAGVVIR